MLEIVAPLLIGTVVGWILFYFIRRYKKFTSTILVATLAAIVVGDDISSLTTMGERFGNRDFHLWYFIGVAAGFLLYGIYVLLVIIFFSREKVKNKKKFNQFLNQTPENPSDSDSQEGCERTVKIALLL